MLWIKFFLKVRNPKYEVRGKHTLLVAFCFVNRSHNHLQYLFTLI
ncbi:hypothetical protein C943_00266 [Mariniradius saccharolyticus AK6]|uniref:Uncharacterized protein n=1 Tax=Mariniradius saccharolyticus AK6 TaxID=1239962 RepID=M7XDN6_9BACT|nr:hypothetical protein C943_00266 [Mariniradius saccharolyticus AK6]